MRSFRLTILILLIVAGFAQAAGRPVLAEGENLLTNPSFEGQYSSYVPELPQEIADCPLGICTTAQHPDGWVPWWVKERPTDVNPEFKPAETNVAGNRVRSGERAAQYFSFWRTHKAGLRQTVTVPTNAVVQFTVWGHAWINNTDVVFPSDYGVTPNMQIGIDPTGGVDLYNPAIVWSGYQQAYDVYQLFSVQAQAQGDKVTVFLFSAPSPSPYNNEQAYLHNDIYWDDASLVVVGAGSAPTAAPSSSSTSGSAASAAAPPAAVAAGPTATPNAEGVIYVEVQSGDSLWSVAARAGLTLDELLTLNNLERDDFIHAGQLLITGYVTPESQAGETTAATGGDANATSEAPTVTPTPAVTTTPQPPTPTAEPAPTGGDICLKAYDDANQNGLHDTGEALRAAVAFTISDGESVVSNYVTDGQSEPYCIRGLPAGNYHVTRSSTPDETLTTPGDWAVAVADGALLNLDFGSAGQAQEAVASADTGAAGVIQQNAGASSEATQPATTEDGGGRMLSGIAIAAVILAVLLLVGVLIFILSARRSA